MSILLLLMVEKGIRGGVFHSSFQYQKGNTIYERLWWK